MYFRIAAAVALAIFLAGTHWKAYHMGGANTRADFAEYKAQRSAESFKASEAARVKENTLNLSNERIRRDLAKEKAARAADAAIAAGRLRDFQSALDSSTSQDSATGPGADGDPRPQILAQCAGQLIALDRAVKRLAGQTIALQDYAANVCLAK